MKLRVAALFLMACGGAECPQPTATPVPAVPSPAPTAAPMEDNTAMEDNTVTDVRMTLDKMDQIVRTMAADVQRQGGIWEFRYEGLPLTIVTDARADRMRIVAPITRTNAMTSDQHDAVMMANFHSALDARYAISQGVLFSAFIHPLSTLHPDDLQSGIRQTANLVRTFGTSYTSGELFFGAAP
ncbi:MAG: hypothetical protein AAGE52_30905 [Myxococcota bacterium]